MLNTKETSYIFLLLDNKITRLKKEIETEKSEEEKEYKRKEINFCYDLMTRLKDVSEK